MTESLCCTLETITILLISYTNILISNTKCLKFKKYQKETKERILPNTVHGNKLKKEKKNTVHRNKLKKGKKKKNQNPSSVSDPGGRVTRVIVPVFLSIALKSGLGTLQT